MQAGSERPVFEAGARARSFRDAFRGVAVVVASQHNAWIHVAFTLGVVAAGLALRVSRVEWALLALAMALVWCAEAFNTALEFLADALHPDAHPLIGRAKDAAAGAVLLAAVGAAAVGLWVLLPRLLSVLSV